MGTYVTFYVGRRDGLAEVVLENLEAFERWVHERASEFPEDFESLRLALERVRSTPDPLGIATPANAADLDLICDSFMGDFCDYGEGRGIFCEASPGTFYLWHYVEAQEQIGRRCGERAAQLWEMMIRGRGIGEHRDRFEYRPSDAGFHVAYWSSSECCELLRSLEKGFGPLVSKARAGAARRSPVTNVDLAIETASEALLRSEAEGMGVVICVG